MTLPQGRSSSPLGRDLVLSTTGVLTTRLVSALGGVFAARLLGPSLRGEYAVVAVAAAVSGTAATFGLEYWVNASIARGDDAAQVRAVARRHMRRAVLSLLVLGIGVAVAVAEWYPALGVAVVAAGTGFAAANVVSMLNLAVLGGRRQMKRVVGSQVLASVVYATLVATLLVLGWASVAGVTLAAMASTVVLAVASWSRPRTRLVPPSAERVKAARTLGLPAMVGEVASLGAYRLNVVVVAVLLAADDAGHYAVAAAIAEVLWVVPDGASQVVLPQTALDERGRATGPIVVLTTAFGAASAVVVSLLGWYLVPIVFGARFADAAQVLPWLAAGAVILGAWKLLLADLAARGRTRVRATTALAAVALTLAGDAILVPMWGIAGAGLASLVSYAVALGLVASTWVSAGGSPKDLYDLSRAWALLSGAIRRLRA